MTTDTQKKTTSCLQKIIAELFSPVHFEMAINFRSAIFSVFFCPVQCLAAAATHSDYYYESGEFNFNLLFICSYISAFVLLETKR